MGVACNFKSVAKVKLIERYRSRRNHTARIEDIEASINIIETEKKTHVARAYLYSCSDSSNAQPPHDRVGNDIPSPKSTINRV
ncbi:hypothetical protein TNCV_3027981 [Trichonephila clavipes]|nr:hypothetical protein TNCV_3027981 [Trichonephila clavipes]